MPDRTWTACLIYPPPDPGDIDMHAEALVTALPADACLSLGPERPTIVVADVRAPSVAAALGLIMDRFSAVTSVLGVEPDESLVAAADHDGPRKFGPFTRHGEGCGGHGNPR